MNSALTFIWADHCDRYWYDLCLSTYGLFLPGCSALVGCEDAARISLLNILTARGDIDLEKLKFAVYDFTSMYTKFTHKMIMTQMTNYIDVTSTATSSSSTTSVQRERSAPWTTRGRVETNISPHGLLFFNGLWQRYISSRCVVFLLVFCSAKPSNAESLLLRAYILAPAASASP